MTNRCVEKFSIYLERVTVSLLARADMYPSFLRRPYCILCSVCAKPMCSTMLFTVWQAACGQLLLSYLGALRTVV